MVTETTPILGPPASWSRRINSKTSEGEVEDSISPIISELTEKQQSDLREFRGRLDRDHPLLTNQEKLFCDDKCLVRCLKARDWNVDHALTQLLSTLSWRKEFQISSLHPDMFTEEASTGKLYRNGFDKHGRPVIYMKPRFENTKDYDNQIRHLVYHLERCVESMDEDKGVESWVLIMDFEGHSLANAVPLSKGRQVLEIITTCYPERLGLAIMVDAPFVFSMFWTAISPFIPPVTKHKIKFCSSPRKGYQVPAVITENFEDLSLLEHDFGGTTKFEYNHQMYWENERNLLAAAAARAESE